MQDWLAQRAARSPERVALIFEHNVWTFRELDERVSRVAQQLAVNGVLGNDRVAVLMRNSDVYVALVHAISRLGAVLVPINTRLTPSELGWQLNHVRVSTLIYDPYNVEIASQTARSAPALRLYSAQNLAFDVSQSGRHKAPPLREQPPISTLHSPHTILFTSGTTGKPKAAVLTYANHWWNAIGSALNLGLHEDDVWLACMPLFHIGGLAILLRSVVYGIPVVLHAAFDAGAVNRALDEQRVTIVSLVSTMLQRVLDARGERSFPASLRCVLLGGGPAPKDLLERCAARNVPVVQTYGLTEAASQVATLAPRDAMRKPGSAGKPLMGVEVKIEGKDTDKSVGEILIRGETVMHEYAEQPEATAHAFRDGWFHTGDLGYMDDEGFLYVVARREDLIISGGENIYPAEVEAVLRAHPEVQDAAVVGVDDAGWMQVPIAFVVVNTANASAEELQRYCGEHLARYKIPTRIIFTDRLPRTASGKLLRRELKVSTDV